MANLSTKELTALQDQLGFEHTCVTKYQAAGQETTDAALRSCFNRFAAQHQQNFNTLLNFLK